MVSERMLKTVLLALSITGLCYSVWNLTGFYQQYHAVSNIVIDEATTRAELSAASVGLITEEYYNRRVLELIKAESIETAESYLLVGREQGLILDLEIQEKYDKTQTVFAKLARQSRRAGQGFLTGQGESVAHIGGAITSDFFLYGDLRDFGKESYHYVNGQEVDEFLFVLSGIGLALAVGTYSTVGGAAPVKYGVSVTKIAKKSGSLTKRFQIFLTDTLRRAVPSGRLKTNLKAVPVSDYLKRLQFSRLKAEYSQAFAKSINHKEMVKLEKVFDDFYAIGKNTGTSATLKLIKQVDKPIDLSKARTVAKIGGKKTLALNDAFGAKLLTYVKTSTKLTAKLVFQGVLGFLTGLFGFVTGLLAFGFERFASRRFLQFLRINQDM